MNRTHVLAAVVLIWLAPVASAQEQAAERQMQAALLAAPPDRREEARVMGYDSEGRLVELRAGRNDITCLADDPSDDRFHVACYHVALEPFMERGRALRAEGRSRAEIDSTRQAEIEAGLLAMPDVPAALYSLTGPSDSLYAATGEARDARPLYVVYIPYATAESTGLSPNPAPGVPWIMFPGKPWAHIMITPPAPEETP